ncbi:hypothetical protein [Bradyrhizobium liaoningense]|uniref:hypothetical protein n=1 Tax=Bradyrhizobium liaoningense TaxID=43992 RepID=UPI001BACB6D9|nr:hypothetical protein [Bradyrhizobium liaoningense]MBR0714795.1 hypothetical protein [Bradyrhizobium liaoningense]
MSMLTHRLERSIHSADHAPDLGALLLLALAILSMGSVLTLLIALRTAVYLWRFHS